MPSLELDRSVGARARLRLWTHGDDRRPTPPGALQRPVRHETLELSWIDEGQLHYEVAGERVTVRAGEAIVVPSGVPHVTLFRARMRGGAVHLSGELVDEIVEVMGPELRAAKPGFGLVREASRALTLARLARDEITSGASGAQLAAGALVDALAVEVLRRAPAGAPRPGPVRDRRILRALEQIHASYAEPLGVDELARTAMMSRFHFTRVFRDEVGVAPYQYLLRVRIARATELLRSGRCSVTEAALSVGFQDFSRFARTFRAHTGKRPVDVLRAPRGSLTASST
jgi:AraC-like DNA-binding protein